MTRLLLFVWKKTKSPLADCDKEIFWPLVAISLETLGRAIASLLKATNTNPEQSIPFLVVPPYLYFVPSNAMAWRTILSALFLVTLDVRGFSLPITRVLVALFELPQEVMKRVNTAITIRFFMNDLDVGWINLVFLKETKMF